jgi:hypothetical protein
VSALGVWLLVGGLLAYGVAVIGVMGWRQRKVKR